VRVTAAEVILFAVTGLFGALIASALITGMALTPDGRAWMRFARRTHEPRRYWITLIVDGCALAFMVWLDLLGNR
jgi:hypothetical protein